MPEYPQRISILVVVDHKGIRVGITAVIKAQPDMKVVGEAGDGEQAIQKFKSVRPDVLLLDWNLPVVRGEAVLRTLSTDVPKPRVIVIGALNEEDCIRWVLSLGAQSYLHKDMLRRELLTAIRAVYQGQRYIPAAIAMRLNNGHP